MPKLSVIVPVYGAEKYVGAMIESLIAQTFTDWEAILVDDGSRDASGKICDEYAGAIYDCNENENQLRQNSNGDPRVKVFHKKNGGVSSARNVGIKHAIGEYITFVDADDTLNPGFLSNFSFNPNLDFEIQGFYLNHLHASDKNVAVTPKETRVATLKEIYAESELLKLTRGPVCKLMKTSIIKENNIRYPSGLSFGEDAIFVKLYLLHCSGNARSIVAADYIYNDFDDPNSLTHRVHPAQAMYDVAKMDLDLYEQLEARLGKMPKDVDSDFRRIRTLEFYQSIVTCMNEESRTSAQKFEFLQMAKEGMYQQVNHQGSLPPTYIIIEFCLSYLPLPAASFVLSKVLK